MPPTRAARWSTTSGRCSARRRVTSASRVRSYAALRGTNTSTHPFRRSSATTCRPRKPEPPVTTIFLPRRSMPHLSVRSSRPAEPPIRPGDSGRRGRGLPQPRLQPPPPLPRRAQDPAESPHALVVAPEVPAVVLPQRPRPQPVRAVAEVDRQQRPPVDRRAPREDPAQPVADLVGRAVGHVVADHRPRLDQCPPTLPG